MTCNNTITFKYNLNFKKNAVSSNLNRLTNHIYKLLPLREEGADWKSVLETIFIEIQGMNSLYLFSQPALFSLVCKLEGLFFIKEDTENSNDNFLIFRKTIFECLSLLEGLKDNGKK